MQNCLKFLTHDAVVLPRDLHAVLDAQTVALDDELVSYLVREFLDVARIEGVTEALFSRSVSSGMVAMGSIARALRISRLTLTLRMLASRPIASTRGLSDYTLSLA